MSSTFAWLDNSERDRRQALDVIDLFSQQGTLDELGIGTIRDALADRMFPGTSTIQTRARYFLFIPWIYQRLERRRTPSADVAARARDQEIRLAQILAKTDADAAGVIGSEAGKHLKRLPSAVYWGGLGAWGIRAFRGSQDQYHRSLDRLYSEERAWRDAARDREGQEAPSGCWHPHIPDPPEDFPHESGFALTTSEAEYLQDRIKSRSPGSVLGFLIDESARGARVGFPWEHDACRALPSRSRGLIAHARAFSEAHHGAALLYNLMLAEAKPSLELVERYQGQFAEWAMLATDRGAALRDWDRGEFWDLVYQANPRTSPSHRRFVDAWIALLLAAPRPGALADNTTARQLIRERERSLKQGRARLAHREYLERWGGASGARQLDYRWGIVQTLVTDILDGLATGAPLAATG